MIHQAQVPQYHATNEAELIHRILHTQQPNQPFPRLNLFERIVMPNNLQRQNLLQQYKAKFGGADLVKELQEKLPQDELASNELFLALLDTPAEHDAKYLHKAMKGTILPGGPIFGLGTNEDMLTEILVTRSNAQIRDIKAAYQRLFNRDLEKDIASDTSGAYRQLLFELLQANRDESFRTDAIQAKKDAQRLYQAGEGKWGTNDSVFIKVLANDNLVQLQLVFNEYEQLGKHHSMEQAVKKEFSGDEQSAMMAIVQFVRNGPVGQVAEMLHHCLSKGGKDEMLIHLIVSHQEMDLEAIALEYQKRFKKPLEKAIEDSSKTSSVLKNALIRMIKGHQPTAFGTHQ